MSKENEIRSRTTRRALLEEGLRFQLANNKIYHKIAQAIQSKQLAVYIFGESCCTLAIVKALDNKYFTLVNTPAEANLLIIHGHISHTAWPLLNAAYQQLCFPQMVVAIGPCAIDNSWSADSSGPNLKTALPIDWEVITCPREESLTGLSDKLKELWLNKLAESHKPQEVIHE